MNLTPEQRELGRRNFLRVLAGTPAVAALGVAAAAKGPVRGGPVRLGFIGIGGQGRVLLEQTDPRYAEVVALCDINPLQLRMADESMVAAGRPGRTDAQRLYVLVLDRPADGLRYEQIGTRPRIDTGTAR